MDKQKWENQMRWGVTSFLVIVSSAFVIMLIHNFKNVAVNFQNLYHILTPIIYGAVMAYLINPAYNFAYKISELGLRKLTKYRKINTEKQRLRIWKLNDRISRFASTIVAVLLIIMVVFGLVSMIIPELYKSILNLSYTLSLNKEKAQEIGAAILKEYSPDILDYYNQYYDELYKYVTDFVQQTLIPNFRNIVTSLGVGIWSVINWLKNFIIGIIIMIYLLNSKDSMLISAKRILFAIMPTAIAQKVKEEIIEIDKMFGGFIVGKLIDSVIIGVICFVVLTIMDMPYTMLVSVVVGVTNVIPFFGPFIGAIPSIILILIADPIKAVYFAIFILILQQIDGNIIGPSVLHGSTGLSSFWVLFSILLFGGLFGFVGMIIGVPIWALVLQLIKRITQYLLTKRKIKLDNAGNLIKQPKDSTGAN